MRQKGPRFHKRKFVRPARLSGGRGGVLGPLRTPKVIAVGKGPILEKHTPAPDRLRGGGRLSFCGYTSRRSHGNRGLSRLFRSAAPFSAASVDVFHRIKKSLPPVENAVHTRTPLRGTKQLLTNLPRYPAAYVRNRPQNWDIVGTPSVFSVSVL